MKNKSNKTLFFSLIMFLFIIVAGYYLGNANNNQNLNTNSSTKPTSSDSTFSTETASLSIKGSVIYASKTSDSTDIYSVSSSGEPKKVYTDKDEDVKIKSAQSITNSGKILAVMGAATQEFGGSLYLIYTDGSGKKDKLIDEFASTQAPIISSNGKKIAYIIFSNAESDYGFTLFVMNSDGSNKQQIATSATGLKILSWNSDNNKIIFINGESSQKSDIYAADLSGAKASEITSFKEKVYSLNWNSKNIILTKGPTAKDEINKSEAYQMDFDGKNITRLTNDDMFENFCFASPNNDATACLTVKYDQNVDINKTGNITIIAGNNKKDIAEGNYIIGWIN